MKGDADDPKALIREAYAIEEIGEAACRTIFLDWALSLPEGAEPSEVAHRLHDRYASGAPDHPMTAVLAEARQRITAPRRRGGWRARVRN